MCSRNDLIRLRHMLDAASEATALVQDQTRDSLDSDRKLPLALIKEIEIIGEAASRITKECQREYPRIP